MADDALTAAMAEAMWERFGCFPTGPLAAWITEQDCRRLADTAMQVVREHTAAKQAEALREAADALLAVPDYTPSDYDRGRVDQRHDDAEALYEDAERLHPEPAPDGGDR